MKNLIFISIIAATLAACSEPNDRESTQSASTQGESTQAGQAITPSYADYPFGDPTLSYDERVNDLVSRLTVTEKIAQMFNDTPAIARLGIPEYNWWNESLHGVARAGDATVFPQAIGLAATFDEDLMHRVATVISDEGRAKYHDFIGNNVHTMYGGLTFWSPNINIFRDPRWGRGQETYGEDPYLTGRMAVNFVKGLQGDDDKYLKAVATIKHYAVHSGPESTRHSDDYRPTKKDLYETYLPAFKTAIAEADVESLMCAYNAVDGQPACGNTELMVDILRGDLGFDGYIVSDCGAIADFYDPNSHAFVKSPAEAAAHAVKSGTDVNCGDHHGNTYANLHYALYKGLITEEEIDVSVKRLFKARMKLGMFDPQNLVPHSDKSIEIVASDAHIALTQEAAEKSLVLLKNDGVLPLKPGIKVAVVGPNAINGDVLIGNYHGNPTQPVTPLQGIIDKLGEQNVTYAPGSSQIGDVYAHHQAVPASVFFHRDTAGALKPGLKAAYFVGKYEGDALTALSPKAKPDLMRIDSAIDFAWKVSPIDQTIEQEFAVVWNGIIKPETTASYDFTGSVALTLDGELVSSPVVLDAGKEYALDARFEIHRIWHSNALAPTAKLKWLALDPKNGATKLANEAVAAAQQSDVVVFMGGIDAHLEGEEMPLELDGFSGGDRTHIKLPKEQTRLLKQLKATGKPVIMVNFSGSAMAMNWEDKNLNAIVQAFYPGEKAGTALANVLWGDTNPSGRLPVTFYSSIEGLPAFNDYTMNNRTYKYYSGTPLYPFGHGLSYSEFTYGEIAVEKPADATQPLTLRVSVTNTSKRAGDDVAQVYASLLDVDGSAIRTLKGFQRVSLTAGANQTLVFTLSPEELRYFDDAGKEQSYAGKVLFTIGSGQEGFVKSTSLTKATVNF